MGDDHITQLRRKVSELLARERQEAVVNIKLPLIVGAALTFLVCLVLWDWKSGFRANGNNFLMSILSGGMGVISTFLCIEYKKACVRGESGLSLIEDSAHKVIRMLENVLLSEPVMRLHKLCSSKYSDVLLEALDKSLQDGGGIVVSAGPKEYLAFLDRFLAFSNNSYFATLRGGEESPKYTLSWFFRDDPPKDPYGLTSHKKLEFLKRVNEAQFQYKVRVILLDPNSDEFRDEFKNDDWRDHFFELNSAVDVYLSSPSEVVAKLQPKGIPPCKAGFIYEDFAIFDDEVVLKHNSRTSLYVATKTQIESFKTLRELLHENPEIFLKLTKSRVGNYSWKEWKEKTESV